MYALDKKNKIEKTDFKVIIISFIFIFVFIIPRAVFAVIPKEYNNIYSFLLLALFIIIGVFLSKEYLKKEHILPLFLTVSFVVLGTINLLVHKATNFFNIIAPAVAFIGYVYVSREKVKVNIFIYVFLFQYVYYYIVYYSILPDLFYRPGFDEDAVVFDNSSSNAIAINLNILLYAYLILSRLNERRDKAILIFAIINFILIIIQQSRGGFIVSASLIFIISLDYYPRRLYVKLLPFIITIIILVFSYSNEINNFFDQIGNMDGINALEEDTRGKVQLAFFDKLDTYSFIFGHNNIVYLSREMGDITYTYNVFLEIWNRYGFLGILIFILIFIYRIVKRKSYFFPIYYFVPFIIYSFIEAVFFPTYWDVIIYILLFTPKRELKS